VVSSQLVVAVERLRDSLVDLRKNLRDRLSSSTSQVTAIDLKTAAAKISEKWLTNISIDSEFSQVIDSDDVADLNVHFQRLLTASEKSAQRSSYEVPIQAILKDFSLKIVVPLKQAQSQGPSSLSRRVMAPKKEDFSATAFLGHSFAADDKIVVDCVRDTLETIGIRVTTGERPTNKSVSEKVKRRIEGQHIFVGLFTRREKIAGKKRWAASPWIVDEKAYALGKGKELILLKEDGVDAFGGLQGDQEYLEFTRDRLDFLVRRLILLFDVSVVGLRAD